MPPDEPTDEERQEELAEDNGTPFQPAAVSPVADPSGNTLSDDHPATDTGIQKEELYDEGVSGAAEVTEPANSGAVADYTPPTDPALPPEEPTTVEPPLPTDESA